MPYNKTTGVISAPVSIADIQSAVPVTLKRTVNGVEEKRSSADLGVLIGSKVGDTVRDNAGGTAWTVSARIEINMWSKFKPVRSNVNNLLDTTPQLLANRQGWNQSYAGDQWWRDTVDESVMACRYGIKPVVATGTNAFNNLYSLISRDWTHIKPQGNAVASYITPYREIDFLGYNHKATKPSGRFLCDSSLVLQDTADGGWSIDAAVLEPDDDGVALINRDYIKPEDILKHLWGVNNIYFGFVVYDPTDSINNRAKVWVTGNRYKGAGTRYLEKGKSYTVVGFYSNMELPEDYSESLNGAPCALTQDTKIAKIPHITPITLNTASAGVTNIKGRYILKARLDNGKLTVEAQISAVSDGIITYTGGYFNNITVYACKGDFDPSQTASSGDILKRWNCGTQYVAPGSKWVGPGNNNKAVLNVSETLTRAACYLYENGTKRVMAYAILNQNSDGSGDFVPGGGDPFNPDL